MRFESNVRNPAWAGLYGPAQPESMPPNEAFREDTPVFDVEWGQWRHRRAFWQAGTAVTKTHGDT